MDYFELVSGYKPTGDQPQAIEKLVKRFQREEPVRDPSGYHRFRKNFTIANVI